MSGDFRIVLLDLPWVDCDATLWDVFIDTLQNMIVLFYYIKNIATPGTGFSF